MDEAYLVPGMFDAVQILPASQHNEMRVLLLLAFFGTIKNEFSQTAITISGGLSWS